MSSQRRKREPDHMDAWRAWFDGGLRRQLIGRIIDASDAELLQLAELLGPTAPDPAKPKPSTARMRKKRARDRGETPGADGKPCFTKSDALQVRGVLTSAGVRVPAAFTPACIHGLNELAAAGVTADPKGFLEAQATLYTRERITEQERLAEPPILWLNRIVSNAIGREVDLTRPASRAE